jgi:hypothetical protein
VAEAVVEAVALVASAVEASVVVVAADLGN